MTAFWVRFGGGLWFTVGVVLFCIALSGAAWSYWKTPGVKERKSAVALFILRGLALVTASFILLHPVLSWSAGKEEKKHIAILVDDSLSMGIKDSIAGLSRADAARKILFEGGDDSLVAGLSAKWECDFFSFSDDLVSVSRKQAGFSREPKGGKSALLKALGKVCASGKRERLQAIFLFTDGRETNDETGAVPSLLPVYPVGLGGSGREGSFKDLSIRAVHAERRALLANRIDATLEITSRGFESLSLPLTLKRGGKKVLERNVEIKPGENMIGLAFVPKAAGLQEYEVFLGAGPGEENLANNRRLFILKVDARKLRVLYFEARPRWKYKFLRQALLRDRNLSVTFQLRTNPSRILQQGKAPVALHSGFPSDMKSLAVFDCVILGDLTSSDLTQRQWRLLVAFVNRAGGGLIYLGGPFGWSQAGIKNSPLAEILPCPGGLGEVRGRLFLKPTREGREHPILSGLTASFEGAGAGRFALNNCFRVKRLRPGARLLALAAAPSGETFPLIAVQRVGAGRTMFFASDTDWRWVMENRRRGGAFLFDHLWGQAVRWTGGREEGVKRESTGIGLVLDRAIAGAGERVRITIKSKNAKKPIAWVERGGKRRDIVLHDSGKGIFTAIYIPREPGRHVVKTKIPSIKEGVKELAAQLMVEADDKEMSDTTLNRPFLERIAQATGGMVFSAATVGKAPEIVAQTLFKEEIGLEIHPRSTPLFFLIIVLLLGAEWWLRRRKYGL